MARIIPTKSQQEVLDAIAQGAIMRWHCSKTGGDEVFSLNGKRMRPNLANCLIDHGWVRIKTFTPRRADYELTDAGREAADDGTRDDGTWI